MNDFLQKALNLSGIEVYDSKIEPNGDIFIYVQSTKKSIPCRICGKETSSYGENQEIKLRHLPILGKRTYIILRPLRGKCDSCDGHPTTNQRHEWYEYKARQTNPYKDYLMLLLINSTVADVCMKESVNHNTATKIVDSYIGKKIDWKSVKRIDLLGIDEISLKKGYQDYMTIITSRSKNGKNKILGVIKGKDKKDIKAFLSTIPNRLKNNICGVCTDMYDGYINAAKEVFGDKCTVIIDRFHVAKLYRKSLTALRKKELKRLQKSLSEKKYKSLHEPIKILCRNSEFVTKEEQKKLNRLFRYSPMLKLAYRYCRKLTAIYNCKVGTRAATGKINKWIKEVENSELKCYNTFIGTLKKYKKEIINYFKRRETSGFVEGLNNKIKVIKRRCYGIFDKKSLFQRLFLDLEGYDLFLGNQQLAHSCK